MPTDCKKCGIKYFQSGPCPQCGPSSEMTATQLYNALTTAGIKPLFTVPSDSDSSTPIVIDTPATMAAHGVSSPVVMLAVSDWKAETLAGVNDGIRDGGSPARCLRRFRAYYRPDDVEAVRNG